MASQKMTEIRLTEVILGALIDEARMEPPLVRIPLKLGLDLMSNLQSSSNDGERESYVNAGVGPRVGVRTVEDVRPGCVVALIALFERTHICYRLINYRKI